jgi:transcriptional regulator with XRE-family HTH domain
VPRDPGSCARGPGGGAALNWTQLLIASTGAGSQVNPTLLRRRLAAELRRLRDASGLGIDEVATHLCCSTSKVSRVETGRVAAMQRDVKDMLDLYRVEGERREALLELARQARRKEDWWDAYGDFPNVRTYTAFERAANSIRIWQSMLIPGLLQVEQYARRTIAASLPNLPEAQLDRFLRLRLDRQALLERPDAPDLEVVLDEAALRRLAGWREVMGEQVDRLIDAGERPNVNFQVLPFDAGPHGGLAESFRMLGFPDAADPDLVHLEHPTGDIYLTSAGQVARYRELLQRAQALALPAPRTAAFLLDLRRAAR